MSLYRLVVPGEESIKILYEWITNEPHRDYFSCRPIQQAGTYAEFYEKVIKRREDSGRIHRVFITTQDMKVLGEIQGFDYNERNHSMEFGYYLPPEHRSKGLGKIMVEMFLNDVFENKRLELNKIYATTSENNEPSKKMLEGIGFKLDGKNREHYWIEGRKYDQYVFSLLRNEWNDSDVKRKMI